jgi:hypothetical protein
VEFSDATIDLDLNTFHTVHATNRFIRNSSFVRINSRPSQLVLDFIFGF